MKDRGLQSVKMPKRVYRPKVLNQHIEPEYAPEAFDHVDVLFPDHGHAIHKQKDTLPPRDDIILWNPDKHEKEFNANIQWRDCPEEYRPSLTALIKEFWDVFDEGGFCRHIRGFAFHIDTGNSDPVCCKAPRYGPHESRVLTDLVQRLLDYKFIDHNLKSPYGALSILAQKPNQEHLLWWEYIFRLCVSYRALNAQTRIFTFPSRRCDDAVEAIFGFYIIQLALNCGYW